MLPVLSLSPEVVHRESPGFGRLYGAERAMNRDRERLLSHLPLAEGFDPLGSRTLTFLQHCSDALSARTTSPPL
jgi:hypothetical protein